MKYVISALSFFEIDAPEVSEEDWELGRLEPIYQVFWEKMRNGTLPKAEIYDIESVEIEKNA